MEKKILILGREDYTLILDMCKTVLESTSGFILIPTETVYGLACLWDNDMAKDCIRQAKSRPENKPFQMLADSITMVEKYGCVIDERIKKIVNAFCPGPITIVASGNDNKIGFRIPEYKFVLDLISYIGKPLAATSANISGEPPALSVSKALSTLNVQPTLSIDGGALSKSSLASTVVEITDSDIKIHREGPVSLSEILKVLK